MGTGRSGHSVHWALRPCVLGDPVLMSALSDRSLWLFAVLLGQANPGGVKGGFELRLECLEGGGGIPWAFFCIAAVTLLLLPLVCIRSLREPLRRDREGRSSQALISRCSSPVGTCYILGVPTLVRVLAARTIQSSKLTRAELALSWGRQPSERPVRVLQPRRRHP